MRKKLPPKLLALLKDEKSILASLTSNYKYYTKIYTEDQIVIFKRTSEIIDAFYYPAGKSNNSQSYD